MIQVLVQLVHFLSIEVVGDFLIGREGDVGRWSSNWISKC